MSYRLIDSNNLTLKYPEVNNMPCIFADLPNGLDGKHYVLELSCKGHWIELAQNLFECSECHGKTRTNTDFCPHCGVAMGGNANAE